MRGLKQCSLVITYADREQTIMQAPLFELDKKTRQYHDQDDFTKSLRKEGIITNGNITNIDIRYKYLGQIKSTELLFKDDLPIPVDTNSLNHYSDRERKIYHELLTMLLLPVHLIKEKRYFCYRNLYLLLRQIPKENTPQNDKQKALTMVG